MLISYEYIFYVFKVSIFRRGVDEPASACSPKVGGKKRKGIILTLTTTGVHPPPTKITYLIPFPVSQLDVPSSGGDRGRGREKKKDENNNKKRQRTKSRSRSGTRITTFMDEDFQKEIDDMHEKQKVTAIKENQIKHMTKRIEFVPKLIRNLLTYKLKKIIIIL